jgi:hypothetical protein
MRLYGKPFVASTTEASPIFCAFDLNTNLDEAAIFRSSPSVLGSLPPHEEKPPDLRQKRASPEPAI